MDDQPLSIQAKINLITSEQSQAVEDKLNALGLTVEDIEKRAYCIIQGHTRTYYMDGIPLVKSSLVFHGLTVTSTVEMLV